jgi:hypothetical protein
MFVFYFAGKFYQNFAGPYIWTPKKLLTNQQFPGVQELLTNQQSLHLLNSQLMDIYPCNKWTARIHGVLHQYMTLQATLDS